MMYIDVHMYATCVAICDKTGYHIYVIKKQMPEGRAIVGTENRAIIDTETGEYITALLPGDRILRSEIIGRLQTENPNKMSFAPDGWGKAYNGALAKLARLKLTAADYRIILLMLPLVRACSGLVAYDNYKPVQIDYIVKQLQISKKTVNTSIQKLIDLRVIARAESGHDFVIFFNPYIYNRGRWINKTLYEMFRRSSWAQERNRESG
jgi:hypothetical protein